ncbi:hypothetical protein GCM10010435_08710 [Winogradskya consettensis]|uniref:RHS repeat-associated protein n=1 Tax=Winogradskya consettensis TaxID=113560 RepID=A0A919SZI2_9ACTN|nr:DUF6531 domain-containing protein [Actinoplanes consettensis]GIM80569.1 hypothetical protein Aco04nite_71430 [Actinoplanes consettensis]
MARPTDWDVLDMDGDPTPGDPSRVRQLASRFHDFAETAHRAKLAVDSLQGDGAVLTWVGLSGDAFREQFGDFPNQVNKLYQSHLMVGDALETYAPTLETAQSQADRALADGRVAAEKLKSLQGALSTAQTDFTGASQAAEKAQAETQAPDPDQVKQAVKDADAAKAKVSGAQSAVNGAQQELDLAKQLAEQARQMRDGAAQVCKREIEDASDAGIQPRSFWQKLGDALKELWNIICEVAKWVALVAGIIGMILGGPLAWIALAAGAILLVKAIVDFAQGKGSVLDLVMGVLGIIPGVKGLTSLSKLSALYKAGGVKEIAKAALTGMKDMAKGMVDLIKNAGSSALTILKNLGGAGKTGLDKLGDLFHGKAPIVPKDVSRTFDIRDCVTDPIDVATGEMVLPELDLELPAPLPFKLERTHLSSYRGGGWFGATWASTLDQRIETDGRASLYFAPDAMVLAYPIGKPGTAVLPYEGPRWPLTIAEDGTARLDTGTQVLGFDREGRLGTVEDHDGNRLRVERDATGAPTGLQHPSGRRVRFGTTDGRITEIALTGATGGPETRIAAFEYEDGHLVRAANASERPATFRYDDAGRIVQWIDRNNFGYRYTYDEQGRCVGTVGEDGYLSATLTYEPERTTFTDSLGNTSVYTFDEWHHRTSTTDPLGNTTRYVWGRYNELLETIDPLGNRVTGDEAGSGLAKPFDVEKMRGPRGERVSALAGWQVLQDREIIRYDDEGYPAERIDALGTVRRTEYGPFGIVLASFDADGLRTAYTHDTELRITSVTDPAGLVWRYTYDATGNMVEESDFNGRVRAYGYDAAGRLATSTNGLGEVTEYVRDALGNVVERRTATGSTRYSYDKQGRILTADTGTTSLAVEYDGFGRVLSETVDGRTVGFEYDDERGTRRRRTPGGVTSEWTSDPFGMPYSLSAGGHEMLVRHDERGREQRRFLDGELVLEQRHGTGDELVEQHLPGVGRRLFEHRADGGVVGIEDWTGRSAFTLDAAGRVTRVEGPGRDETYGYADGRLAAAYEGTLLTASGAVSCTYDAHGRMTTRTVAGSGTWHFTWNTEDQLSSVRTPRGEVWTYVYDPLGRRVAKHRMTGTEIAERYEFAWSGSSLIEQAHTAADGTLRLTTWEHDPVDGRPIAQTVHTGSGVDFATVVTDRIGTATELLAADGSLLWRNESTLWGDAGPSGVALGFPGQYRDDETGLHYNVYRYYDPMTGRYLSQDPLGLAPAADPGGYAANPLLVADPLGLMCSGPSGSKVPPVTPGAADNPGIVKALDEANDIKPGAFDGHPVSVTQTLSENGKLPDVLYHGSDVPPNVIFEQGLKSFAEFKGAPSHYDIKLHQQSSSKIRDGGAYSGFISTTSDTEVALNFVRSKDIAFRLQNLSLDGVQTTQKIGKFNYDFHFGYIYLVKSDRQPFIDLTTQVNQDISKVSQKEWAALDHIPGKDIIQAWKIDGPYDVAAQGGKVKFPVGVPIKEFIDNPHYVP